MKVRAADMMSGVYITLALVLLTSVACGKSALVDQVAARVDGNLVLVDARVNDSPPLTFILDTGASGLVLDTRRVQELGLESGASDDAQTGGGSVTASGVKGVTVHVGRAGLPGVDVAGIDLRPLEAGLGRRIDGVLGYDLFARFVVEIDYQEQAVRLHDPTRFEDDGGRAAVPLTISDQLPFVGVGITRPGGGVASARLELDTGLTGSLTLTRPFVEQNHALTPSQPRLRITTGALLPGQVSAEVARIGRIRLGPFDIENLVASITPTSEAAGVSGDTAGLLGGDVLRRFTVVIDYPHSRMLLEPNDVILQVDEFDMSGMSLTAAKPQTYSVRTVIDGSPAAEAGVKPGDVLVTIDSKGASQMSLNDIRMLFQQEGKTYALMLKRGDHVGEVRLTTRRMI